MLRTNNRVRKPLKACADHTRADHTRQRLVVWSAAVEGFVIRVCMGLSSESLKRGKIECPCWEKLMWVAYIISFYYYNRNMEMSIYRHRFLMNNKAVR